MSLGNSIHSSWNYFLRKELDVEIAIRRAEINGTKKLNHLIPLCALFISFKKEDLTKEIATVIMNHFQKRIEAEKSKLSDGKTLIKSSISPCNNSCYNCMGEVVNYYCLVSIDNDNYMHCLYCMANSNEKNVYFLYDEDKIQAFYEMCQNKVSEN